MTDKEKIDLIRAEVERMMAEEMEFFKTACEEGDVEISSSPTVYTRLQMLLSFIDSMQEEPKDKCKGCNNVKGCVTCVDGSEWAHYIDPDELTHSVTNISDQVEPVSEEPKYKRGDVLVNRKDGSKITIVAIVADQYKYVDGGNNYLYDFTDCIEAQYIKEGE